MTKATPCQRHRKILLQLSPRLRSILLWVPVADTLPGGSDWLVYWPVLEGGGRWKIQWPIPSTWEGNGMALWTSKNGLFQSKFAWCRMGGLMNTIFRNSPQFPAISANSAIFNNFDTIFSFPQFLVMNLKQKAKWFFFSFFEHFTREPEWFFCYFLEIRQNLPFF